MQLVDRGRIGLDRARVQIDDAVRRLEALALGDRRGLLGLERLQLALESRRQAALRDGVDNMAQLALDHCQAPRQVPAPQRRVAGEARTLLAICHQRRAQRLGRQQLAAQAFEHAALKLGDGDGPAVVAGAAFLVARAAEPVARLDGIGAAAAAAHQAREQMPRPALLMQRRPALRAGALLHRLGGLPEILVDDAQLGHRHDRPVFRIVRPRDAPARLRVFDHGNPVVDQLAGVKAIVENAIAALWVAVDRAGVPMPPGRRRHAFGVERLGDGARALAGDILGEDAANDVRLGLVDAAQAAPRLAVVAQLAHHDIAIRASAGGEAFEHAAELAAPRLDRQVFQKQGIHRALQADMQLGNLAFGDGDELHAGEDQALIDAGHVFLIAREPIERLGEHQIETARAGIIEQPARLGPRQEMRAAQRIIAIGIDGVSAELRRMLAAEPHLVLDRATVLLLAGKPRIDRGAHGSGILGRCRLSLLGSMMRAGEATRNSARELEDLRVYRRLDRRKRAHRGPGCFGHPQSDIRGSTNSRLIPDNER